MGPVNQPKDSGLWSLSQNLMWELQHSKTFPSIISAAFDDRRHLNEIIQQLYYPLPFLVQISYAINNYVMNQN